MWRPTGGELPKAVPSAGLPVSGKPLVGCFPCAGEGTAGRDCFFFRCTLAIAVAAKGSEEERLADAKKYAYNGENFCRRRTTGGWHPV